MKRSLVARTTGAADAPADDLGKALASLRQTLANATDFLQPWEQFHDEVVTLPASTSEAEAGSDERLTAMLRAMGEKVLGQREEPKDERYFHLAAHGFWHGAGRVGKRLVIFFYFEEGDIGLAGFIRDANGTEIDLLRFSIVPLPPATAPSRGRGVA